MSKPGTAVVTGGGAGIGRAISLRLSRSGYNVIAVDLNEDQANETAQLIKEAGGEGKSYALDITDGIAVEKFFNSIPQVDCLINNAGTFNVKKFAELTVNDFRSMYEVNLVAMFDMAQKASFRMPEGGSIINIASRAMLGAKEYIHYSSSKAAVVGFTRSLALELANKSITVNAVAPGVIETDMLKSRSDTDLDALRSMQPMGQLGSADDIAGAVNFLSSHEARFITGQVMLVDGGRSLGGVTNI
ncbi:SDR family NAD(P)-dependent oxidoreductase [Halomonas sp. HAL1]|uniref:SDR family NAD(P)-dependent oxidoreductase n=1 Tax=Halomonas sp. HAL1 TaxID=550984 RepID=UPI00022D31CC|nr:SDR family NAD(P)-dependent oxidoreductase [Halomonas sp. HAL1]EHA16479.1 short-chain dehydrogenase/reductase SDR [Halomonas sp. HAL1]WKV92691.1 SDR family NAD(P)-dependent oxidoreductase [Halomonas sp. HAL1]